MYTAQRPTDNCVRAPLNRVEPSRHGPHLYSLGFCVPRCVYSAGQCVLDDHGQLDDKLRPRDADDKANLVHDSSAYDHNGLYRIFMVSLLPHTCVCAFGSY